MVRLDRCFGTRRAHQSHSLQPSGQLSTFLQGNFKPIYEPNSNGDPTKHLPKVTVSGNDVSVEIPHVMTEEHYIKFM